MKFDKIALLFVVFDKRKEQEIDKRKDHMKIKKNSNNC
jgi:hypothetical protein